MNFITTKPSNFVFRNDNATIEPEDIVRELQTIGKKISKAELKQIMKVHDPQKKGYIDYTEFEAMILAS